MAPCSKSAGDSRVFFCVIRGEEEEKVMVSRLLLLGSSGRWVGESSSDVRWLVMVVDIHGHEIHLLNPITGGRIPLPTTTIFSKYSFMRSGFLARKFIVYPGPGIITAVGCGLMVDFAGNDSGIYCPISDYEKWAARMERSPMVIHDCIYHKGRINGLDDPPETSMAVAALTCPMTDGRNFVEQSAGGSEPLQIEFFSQEQQKTADEVVDKTAVVTTAVASWSDLPEGLLWSVAKLLNHKDFFNIGSVCSSWRSLALQCRSVLPRALPLSHCLYSPNHPTPPLLMLQSKQDGDSWDFYSVSEKKILSRISLPGTKNMWVCGSSPNGWLAMAEFDGNELCLLNPISNARVPLPPASTMWEPRGTIDCGHHLDSTFFVNKIVDFSSVSDGLVVALCDNMSRFYYCKMGDAKWSRVEDSPVRSEDIICYKGKLLAAPNHPGLLECDFSGSTPEFKVLARMGDSLTYQRYIVESVEGELLQIMRYYIDFDKEDDNGHYGGGGDDRYDGHDPDLVRLMRTDHFKVFKLEESSEENEVMKAFYQVKDHSTGELRCIVSEADARYKWVEKESIGDQIIFVGYTYSMAVPAYLFSHCKGNMIYFSDDYECRTIDRADMIDVGIYDLEDGSIHYFHTDDQVDPFISSAWIIPTL